MQPSGVVTPPIQMGQPAGDLVEMQEYDGIVVRLVPPGRLE